MNYTKKISWGYDNLNRIAGRLCQGKVYVVAGGACSGKTPFMLNVASHVAIQERHRVLYLVSNGEEYKNGLLDETLVMINGEINAYELFGMNYGMWERGYKAALKVHESPLEIINLENYITFYAFLESLYLHNDIKVLIVDDVNGLMKKDDREKEKKIEITVILRELKQFARKHGIAVIVGYRTEEEINKPGMTLWETEDAEQDKAIWSDVDCFILMVRRDCYEKITEGKELVEFMLYKDFRPIKESESVQLEYVWDMRLFKEIE